MNLADLCPEGREKYAEWKRWERPLEWVMRASPHWVNIKSSQHRAWQAYLEHKRTCAFCKEE